MRAERACADEWALARGGVSERIARFSRAKRGGLGERMVTGRGEARGVIRKEKPCAARGRGLGGASESGPIDIW